MSWHFLRSPTTMDVIEGLPFEAQLALADLIDRLEADPYAATRPFGVDDHITREAPFGAHGLLVMFVNPVTERITPLSFTWTD